MIRTETKGTKLKVMMAEADKVVDDGVSDDKDDNKDLMVTTITGVRKIDALQLYKHTEKNVVNIKNLCIDLDPVLLSSATALTTSHVGHHML